MTRILVTSDWQAEYENLDLCQKALDEIIELRRELKFKVLIHAGDLKHSYNPVDVRVVNFWLKAIGQLKQECLDVVVCLGNHDRVGMHVDKQNWLPVLRKAGAEAYDETSFARAGNGQEIAVLPFRRNSVLLRREANDLAKVVGNRKPVLIFHTDIERAKYSVVSSSDAGEKIQVEDLCPDKYLFCIGGHIHYQQKVAGNVWYVGSPFATDWGEANQRKGYLLIDTVDRTIKRVRSKIPGWYDPAWPGFQESKPESWDGAKVRIKVPCEGVTHVREQLERAKKEADKTYAGASIFVVPEFNKEHTKVGNIKLGFPDEKKIRIYVQETLPDELKKYETRIKSFLIEQLSLVGGLVREQGELCFKKILAKNFLSYKDLKMEFDSGLCVVAGENRDWKGRSNGAGKSSYLQPVAVALFGQTFKRQKHDGWMRRGTEKDEKAFVKIWFDDSQGRQCSVKRARQPKELILKVDGEIIESGNRPENTQKLIEQASGYTWETLANAIYIDQASSHLMLTGTEAERKGFLAKLQNLERFERAEKAIKEQKVDFERRYTIVSEKLQSVLTEEKGVLATISDAKKILALNENISVSYKKAKRRFLVKRDELRAWEEKAENESARIAAEITAIRKVDLEYESRRATTVERLNVLKNRLAKFKKMEGVCPTCEQMIDKEAYEIAIPEMEEKISGLEKQLEGYDELEEKRETKIAALEEESTKWLRNKKLAGEVSDLELEKERKQLELQQYSKQQELLEKLRSKVRDYRKKKAEIESTKKKLSKWLQVLKYSQTVFQRDGLPAYLNEQVCPELNQAAEEYAELFAQREIQIMFAVDEDGKMDVKVVNAHGGTEIEDQSEGEMKMASLITSFAVRSIAPKTNILILDEPGDGLDSTSAKSFARGLKKVVSKFGSILLTTHNPNILSELSDAKQVFIVKESGVSRVKEVDES